MIVYACIARMEDSLPLSASTDSDDRPELIDSQRCGKLLLRKINLYPDRMTLETDCHLVHTISTMSLCFLAITNKEYPPVLAFCFLDEIQKEFIVTYPPDKIQRISRPYTLIDFDATIHRVKQRYNNTRSLATRVNLSDMSTELKLRPPFQLTADDIRPYRNGSPGTYTQNVSQIKTPFSYQHFKALSLFHRVTLALLIACGFLNWVRGVMALTDRDTNPSYHRAFTHGLTFMFAGSCFLHQMYLLISPTRWRIAFAVNSFVWVCVCSVMVSELRTVFQLLLHVTVAAIGSFAVIQRALVPKSPHYNV
ncbi:PREDICTED: vesicle-trafficking protein SEC22a-like [Priapulus caudatus]|uniref:Vesicle-trafficking protein SEC22a-like n=1 Tax=Priapulus caudatus TaxID=37621 RepID=A0ABM1EN91_PRICU|nr:PREDICTED: vesicle-trafficking protein SEC22a-like [Priapulus caudatus]XP_014673661.1 PREDICTED: vesicle-trafficking protein SEC22a-like [Priapulus caudatus]XP_014673662.1 PREDICTED: vesicle-trafficking protein SEC22a-like [Priapulus caudatus]